MHIVVEGPDNSGKTTLVKFLGQYCGLTVQHSGGPSKHPGEINARCDQLNANIETMIFDRHPAVSQNLYNEALGRDAEAVTEDRIQRFYAGKPLIIYCRPVDGAVTYDAPSPHADADHNARVMASYDSLQRCYDDWAIRHASYVYRIGDDMSQVAKFILARLSVWPDPFSMWSDIIAFHHKFGHEYEGPPRQLPDDLLSFRLRFLEEEFQEYRRHANNGGAELAGHDDPGEFVLALDGQADSLVDLVYVALGTAYLQGFNFPEMWARVQAANMAKVRAVRKDTGEAVTGATDSGRAKQFDVVKPAGWHPPTHIDLVEAHAHRDAFKRSA